MVVPADVICILQHAVKNRLKIGHDTQSGFMRARFADLSFRNKLILEFKNRYTEAG